MNSPPTIIIPNVSSLHKSIPTNNKAPNDSTPNQLPNYSLLHCNIENLGVRFRSASISARDEVPEELILPPTPEVFVIFYSLRRTDLWQSRGGADTRMLISNRPAALKNPNQFSSTLAITATAIGQAVTKGVKRRGPHHSHPPEASTSQPVHLPNIPRNKATARTHSPPHNISPLNRAVPLSLPIVAQRIAGPTIALHERVKGKYKSSRKSSEPTATVTNGHQPEGSPELALVQRRISLQPRTSNTLRHQRSDSMPASVPAQLRRYNQYCH